MHHNLSCTTLQTTIGGVVSPTDAYDYTIPEAFPTYSVHETDGITTCVSFAHALRIIEQPNFCGSILILSPNTFGGGLSASILYITY